MSFVMLQAYSSDNAALTNDQVFIKLYVRDNIFNPYLRAQVEMEFYQALHQNFEQQAIRFVAVGLVYRRPTLGEPPSATETLQGRSLYHIP